MPPSRPSLAQLMAVVAVLAAGLGAMRNGSTIAKKLIWSATLIALLVGLLGAIVRRGEGAWVGFALFGWGYALVAFDPGLGSSYYQRLVFADLVEVLVPKLHPIPGPRPSPPALNPDFADRFASDAYLAGADDPDLLALLTPGERDLLGDFRSRFLGHQRAEAMARGRQINARDVGHALITLGFALLGAVLGKALERPRAGTLGRDPVS